MLRNYHVIYLGVGTGFEEPSDSVILRGCHIWEVLLSLALES